MAKSKIQWTDATWNPIVGCSLASAGCKRCYAMRMAARLEAMAIGQEAITGKPSPVAHYKGLTQPTKNGPVWTGEVRRAPDSIFYAPLTWRKARRVFVNSMSDLFHPDVSDETVDEIFAIMALCPHITFQVLTKRPDRMRQYMDSIDNGDGFRLPGFRAAMVEGMAQKLWHDRTGDTTVDEWLAVHLPLPNVWLGTSVEDQRRSDERIPDLIQTPAAVRFLSCEPLLESLNLSSISTYLWPRAERLNALTGELSGLFGGSAGRTSSIAWLVVGMESGPGARHRSNDIAQALVDQCVSASVPVFVKQLSGKGGVPIDDIEQFPEGLRRREFPA